jgi:hypothetical protein
MQFVLKFLSAGCLFCVFAGVSGGWQAHCMLGTLSNNIVRNCGCLSVSARMQVSLVDGKPIVCIDMGEGKPDLQAVEEKILAEMHSLTMKQGQAVAQQAQFIIVGSDLPPERTLSTISEGTLHMQPSAGSALVSGGAAAVPQGDGGSG